MNANTETQKTRFLSQLIEYGLAKIVWSPDFLIASAVFVTLVVDRKYQLNVFLPANDTHIAALFAASSTLFSITLATLAIILSFSSGGFMSFLRKHNKLSPLLFLFWLGNSSYLMVVVLSLTYLTVNLKAFPLLDEYLYPTIAGLFVYSLISTFYLLGTVIRFGYFLDIYERLTTKGE